MSSFDWKKMDWRPYYRWVDYNSSNHRNIFLLTTVNKKRPKASLDTTDIMRDAGGIHGAVLIKDYVVFKEMDQ